MVAKAFGVKKYKYEYNKIGTNSRFIRNSGKKWTFSE